MINYILWIWDIFLTLILLMTAGEWGLAEVVNFERSEKLTRWSEAPTIQMNQHIIEKFVQS